MARDNPSFKSQSSVNVKVISRPDAGNTAAAWPATQPDSQFDPGCARPANGTDATNISNDFSRSTVGVPATEDDASMPLAADADDTSVEDTEVTTVGDTSTDGAPQSDAASPVVEEPALPEDLEDAALEQGPDEQPAIPGASLENSSSVGTDEVPPYTDEVTDPTATDADDEAAGDKEMMTDADPAAGASQAANASLPERPMADEEKSDQEALALYAKIGGVPDLPPQGVVFSAVRQVVRKKVRSKDEEEKIRVVNEAWEAVHPIILRLRAGESTCAILMGDIANVAKEDIPHGQWLPYARQHFTGIDIRSLQDYMKIARVRSVEKHRRLGVKVLVKLASLVSSSNLENEDDPIQVILDKARTNSGYLDDDYNLLAKIAVADTIIRKAGLTVAPDALREFVEAGLKLNKKCIQEIQEMVKLGQDPSDFLTNSKNAAECVFRILGDKKGVGQDISDEGVSIPDLNTTFARASETIALALRKPDLQASDVDRELYDQLLSDLQALGRTMFAA